VAPLAHLNPGTGRPVRRYEHAAPGDLPPATRAADLGSLQRVNTVRSVLLLAAAAVQVVAVVLPAWSVTVLLR